MIQLLLICLPGGDLFDATFAQHIITANVLYDLLIDGLL